MGMFTNIYIDANLDIRELAIYLLPELPTSGEIKLVRSNLSSIQYGFFGQNGRPMGYLSENSQVYLYEIGMASYRYKLSAIRGPQIPYMQAAYEHLLQHACFPLAYQKVEQVTDFTYNPTDYVPNYSLITRLMPVELLLWTNLSEGALLRKLKGMTGMNLSSDHYFSRFQNKGASGYVSKIYKQRHPKRHDPTSRYARTTAPYYIRVFGLDDDPLRRRVERDALARRLYTSLLEEATIPVNIFEVVACEFLPFV